MRDALDGGQGLGQGADQKLLLVRGKNEDTARLHEARVMSRVPWVGRQGAGLRLLGDAFLLRLLGLFPTQGGSAGRP